MKRFLKTAAVLMACVAALSVISCGKPNDDTGGKGKKETDPCKVSLSVAAGAELVAAQGEELQLGVTLTRALDEALELTFGFTGGTSGGVAVVGFDVNPLTVPAGSTTATLLVKPENVEAVTDEMTVTVTLKNSSDKSVTLAAGASFTLVPAEKNQLTPAQIALIEGYKTNPGVDLMHWIGDVPVEVKLFRTGNEAYWGMFLEDDDITITGTTAITLSEHATASVPVLKMTSNAMGIADYLYDILRGVTLENRDYWLGDAAAPEDAPYKYTHAIMEATGLSATSGETFDVALDNIILNGDGTVDFVSQIENVYGDPIHAVDFIYTYSAWNRMKEMLEGGDNALLQEAAGNGYTLDPAHFFNISTIDSNYWEGYEGAGNWLEPAAGYDGATGEMSFDFPMDFDYNASADYMRIEVRYGSAKPGR